MKEEKNTEILFSLCFYFFFPPLISEPKYIDDWHVHRQFGTEWKRWSDTLLCRIWLPKQYVDTENSTGKQTFNKEKPNVFVLIVAYSCIKMVANKFFTLQLGDRFVTAAVVFVVREFSWKGNKCNARTIMVRGEWMKWNCFGHDCRLHQSYVKNSPTHLLLHRVECVLVL